MRAGDANPEREMPFTEHLEELRWHLLRCILYLAVAFCLCWWQYDPIYAVVSGPVQRAFAAAHQRADLVYMDILEPLMFKLQVTFAVSVIVTLPLILVEVWKFIAPGLYPNERRYVRPLLPFSIVLCFAGFGLIYYALPIAFEFLLKFAPQTGEARVMQHLDKYYDLLLRMMIAAGLVFQTPLVLYIAGQLELVTSRGLLTYWRHAVLVCFTIAAIITPTIDPFNMSVIAIPMVGLFFLSVFLVWTVERDRRKRGTSERRLGHDDTPPPPPPDDPGPPAPPPADPPSDAVPMDPGITAPVVDRSAMGPLAIPPAPADDADEASFDPGAE